ncbi:hypothetical protein KXW53_002193 [Aspergillus fumigatus]|nr:hypothetical protein KXX47_007143 [Aspergillus fumigatus]KAH1404465.1 hypothetical protein KXX22_001905 [Aspergillus fumigatus]KAH1970006.1 hypothetical protein KXV80_000959 [Aspergillus fumigatus]KAH2240299.1 hypothetical protein KXW14_008904 [Aspergillus fumigatus]KAH2670822.1 hypothetical protein KXV96_002896 [Aspergillus fumigatus]
MSLQEIQNLRRRLEEEQRLREEEQQLREKEQQLREQAERSQIQAEEQLKLQTQETTLPEFLDACHVHLFLGLSIQKDRDSSTKGDPANADRKLRPTNVREWISFPREQAAIWEDLMDTDFATERHFTPLLALKEYGKEARERMVSSELDLSYFQRQTVESRVASVVKQLHANPRLRQVFCLNGDITFENHANTLTDESNFVAEMDSLSLSLRQPRRSDRLAAKLSRVGLSAQPPRSHQKAIQSRTSRPRADQFCVYNKGPEGKVPAFIIEYKAPHKVSLAHIRAGLQDMDLDEVLRLQEEESPEDICRRIVAAIITQTFSYMIHCGVEFGLVCTGEAYIYLRVSHNDPSTIYYYLSVPEEDVGRTTGWAGDLNSDNQLHLTAVGQLLAFTLRALRVPVRDIAWTTWAASKLQTWEMIYDDLLEEIAEKDIPASDFKPSTRSRLEYCRASPVKTRSRSAVVAAYLNPTHPVEDDLESPAFLIHRPPHLYRRYRSLEDPTRKESRGSIARKTLIRRLKKQFSSDILRPDTKLGCESLHVHGRRGALFKITLWSHGYTFVGKGAPMEFVDRVENEELVYSRLNSIQGTSVPVLLGSLRLRRSFSYDGIAEIVHLMCMGFAGRTLARAHALDRSEIIQRAETSLQEIHNLGVLHCDPIPGNMTWNEQDHCVMFIDFERSTLQSQRRVPLGIISSNQKRKREVGSAEKKGPNKRLSCFVREKRRMINGL